MVKNQSPRSTYQPFLVPLGIMGHIDFLSLTIYKLSVVPYYTTVLLEYLGYRFTWSSLLAMRSFLRVLTPVSRNPCLEIAKIQVGFYFQNNT